VKSYGEYCALARGLDVIGDRWSLLIVRELLIRPCRYTDLRDGLPGIASNLLADRLRQLADAGVVTARKEPPPIATTVYRLTERGRELEPALRELARWGAPLMVRPPDGDAFRSPWLVLAAEVVHQPPADGAERTIQLETGAEPVVVRTGKGRVQAHLGTAQDADLVVAADPPTLLGLLSGRLAPDETDAVFTGDITALTGGSSEAG
jgi:DNA-binding HxlR family transcriptional regulator